jgi:hypothetical protein
MTTTARAVDFIEHLLVQFRAGTAFRTIAAGLPPPSSA